LAADIESALKENIQMKQQGEESMANKKGVNNLYSRP
jgi:hypothetical protein